MVITDTFAIANTENAANKEAERQAKKIKRQGYEVLEYGSKSIQVERLLKERFNGEYIEELEVPEIVIHNEYQAYVTYIDEDAE